MVAIEGREGVAWPIEVIGMVLAPALFFRAAVHIFVALGVDYDPRLDNDSDVSLASPVPSLRGDSSATVARLCSTALAFAFAESFQPVAGAGIAGAWLTLNWGVLVCDPLAGALLWIQRR